MLSNIDVSDEGLTFAIEPIPELVGIDDAKDVGIGPAFEVSGIVLLDIDPILDKFCIGDMFDKLDMVERFDMFGSVERFGTGDMGRIPDIIMLGIEGIFLCTDAFDVTGLETGLNGNPRGNCDICGGI
jgi:hypothetical protein